MNGLNSTLTLDNKYNNGRRYQAEIITEYDISTGTQYYILFAKNETTQDRKKNSNQINRKNVFKIKQVSHHIGGVRPTFHKACLPINITSFLGFLKLTSQLTNEAMSYGITKTDKQVSGTIESFNEVINKFYERFFDYKEFVSLKTIQTYYDSCNILV